MSKICQNCYVILLFSDIRKQERKYLEKSAYVQCLSIAMTPVVPVIAAIITFLAHIGTGNNLTAAQVSIFPFYVYVN